MGVIRAGGKKGEKTKGWDAKRAHMGAMPIGQRHAT